MSDFNRKKDRTARLLKLQLLLSQHPKGINVKQIAERCSVSKRTVYRDLATLEYELDIPIWEDGNKRGIQEDYFLPPINLTLHEATNIFICIRLLRNYRYINKKEIISTFMKLNSIVPQPLKKLIQETLEDIENWSDDKRREENFKKIIEAWSSRHRVMIFYQRVIDPEPKPYIIDPYFIEPSAMNRAFYVIAYSQSINSVHAFDISRIIGEVSIQSDTYTIPADFNEMDYLSSTWDVHNEGKLQEVKLLFTPIISKVILHSPLHSSSVVEIQNDGSLIVKMKIRISMDFVGWILSWGDDVEVLEPLTLRNWVIEINQSIRRVYSRKHLKKKSMSNDGGSWINVASPSPIELTDEQWQLISRILPKRESTGRPKIDERKIINGIIWVLRNGGNWARVSPMYASPSTCNSKFLSWQKEGVWEKIQKIIITHDKRFNDEDLTYLRTRNKKNKSAR